MKTVERYYHPADLSAALAAAAGDPDAVWLAGGTSLFAGDYADKPAAVIDISTFIPRGVAAKGSGLSVGAGTTFQELIDSELVPAVLKDAALGIGSRNVRNRATVGGNIAADRACSSLIPSLLVLDAKLEIAGVRSPASSGVGPLDLRSWLDKPEGLILAISFPVPDKSRRSAYGRWARIAVDAAVLGAALCCSVEKGLLKDVRIALGGISGKSRRMRELEARLEGWRLPAPSDDPRADIETAALPFLAPAEGGIVSASFKRLRGAALLADVVAAAIGGMKEGPR